MSKRFKVVYDIKSIDKNNNEYGVLMECTDRFQSFTEAVNFVRLIRNKLDGNVKVVGKPILERV